MQVTEKPCCRKNGLAAVGFWESLVPAAASLLTGGGTGGSGGAPSSAGAAGAPITVSPQISTQISPQISPVFQQQFQPQNSSATAGTSQALPAMPGPAAPGYSGAPLPAGYAPAQMPAIPMPAVPEQNPIQKYLPWILGGFGVMAAVVILRKRKGSAK